MPDMVIYMINLEFFCYPFLKEGNGLKSEVI